jgi:hypothetical protein
VPGPASACAAEDASERRSDEDRDGARVAAVDAASLRVARSACFACSAMEVLVFTSCGSENNRCIRRVKIEFAIDRQSGYGGS